MGLLHWYLWICILYFSIFFLENSLLILFFIVFKLIVMLYNFYFTLWFDDVGFCFYTFLTNFTWFSRVLVVQRWHSGLGYVLVSNFFILFLNQFYCKFLSITDTFCCTALLSIFYCLLIFYWSIDCTSTATACAIAFVTFYVHLIYVYSLIALNCLSLRSLWWSGANQKARPRQNILRLYNMHDILTYYVK